MKLLKSNEFQNFLTVYYYYLRQKDWVEITFKTIFRFLVFSYLCTIVYFSRPFYNELSFFEINLPDKINLRVILIFFLLDILYKLYFRRYPVVIPFFKSFKNGNKFQYYINLFFELISTRNFYLIPIILCSGIDYDTLDLFCIYLILLTNSSFVFLNCKNGYNIKLILHIIFSVILITLGFINLYYHSIYVFLLFLQLIIYIKIHKKNYHYNYTYKNNKELSNISFSNNFLNLDYWTFIKNKGLLKTLFKSILISGLYLNVLLSEKAATFGKFEFILLSVYISIIPIIIIPLLLSINWKMYGLLLTIPNIIKFYEVKFNYLVLIQLLLLGILLIFSPIEKFWLFLSISFFTICFTNSLLFFTIHFTRTEIVLDENKSSLLTGLPSLSQNIYIFFISAINCTIIYFIVSNFPKYSEIMLLIFVTLFLIFKKNIFSFISKINQRRKYYIFSKISFKNDD